MRRTIVRAALASALSEADAAAEETRGGKIEKKQQEKGGREAVWDIEGLYTIRRYKARPMPVDVYFKCTAGACKLVGLERLPDATEQPDAQKPAR